MHTPIGPFTGEIRVRQRHVRRRTQRQGCQNVIVHDRNSRVRPVVIKVALAGWRSSAHPRNWLRSLEVYAFPLIGKVAVSEVTSADVLEILTPHLAREGDRRPGPCTCASARCWNGPSPWIGERTTRATGSCRCSAPNTTPSHTGGPCPIWRCQRPLVKTGGRMIKYVHYDWLLLAGGHLTRRRIEASSLPAG